MANVQVFQRHAHLAGAVKLEFVNGREGKIAKAVLTAISNTRRGSGEAREEESTAIQWTLWGKQAENAAEYLGKGSHVNIVGRLRNNNYEKDGETVYGMAFTAEEIARRGSQGHCGCGSLEGHGGPSLRRRCARRGRRLAVTVGGAGSPGTGVQRRADQAARRAPDDGLAGDAGAERWRRTGIGGTCLRAARLRCRLPA